MEKERQEIEGKSRVRTESIYNQYQNDVNMNAHGDTVVVWDAARIEQALSQLSGTTEVVALANEVDASISE